MGRDNGWEGVATAWADFVRSDADVLFESNFEQLLRMLPPPGRLTVDVGCGEGRVDRRLSALGHSVVGVDGSETLIRLAREMDPAGDGGDFERRGDGEEFVVDAYFPERTRLLPLLHEEIEQYHRPLGVYLNAVTSAGFALEEVRETPAQRRAPGRVPMFLHVRAQRRDGVERRSAG